MASATAEPLSTPAHIDRGVYVTATPCAHHTVVRITAAGFAQRHDPGAQCKACHRRWRLWIVNDPERGCEALWQEMDPW